MATYYSVTMKISDEDTLTYLSGEVEADKKPEDTVVEYWFDSLEEARAFIADQKIEQL